MRDSHRNDGSSEPALPADRPESIRYPEPLEDEVERALAALYGDDDDPSEDLRPQLGAPRSTGRARGAGATP